MDKGPAYHQSFLADQVARGNAGGHVLRRDHLAHDGPRRVASSHQNRTQIELAGRDDLQIAKKRIAGGITTTQETGNPTQENREEGEDRTYFGDSQAQRIGHARVVEEKGQSYNQHDRQNSEAK